jgi:hypothetical protein
VSEEVAMPRIVISILFAVILWLLFGPEDLSEDTSAAGTFAV